MVFWRKKLKIGPSDEDIVNHLLLLMKEDPEGWTRFSICDDSQTGWLYYKPTNFCLVIEKKAIKLQYEMPPRLSMQRGNKVSTDDYYHMIKGSKFIKQIRIGMRGVLNANALRELKTEPKEIEEPSDPSGPVLGSAISEKEFEAAVDRVKELASVTKELGGSTVDDLHSDLVGLGGDSIPVDLDKERKFDTKKTPAEKKTAKKKPTRKLAKKKAAKKRVAKKKAPLRKNARDTGSK